VQCGGIGTGCACDGAVTLAASAARDIMDDSWHLVAAMPPPSKNLSLETGGARSSSFIPKGGGRAGRATALRVVVAATASSPAAVSSPTLSSPTLSPLMTSLRIHGASKRRPPTPAIRVSLPTLSDTVVAATRAPRLASATDAKRSTDAAEAVPRDSAAATAAAAFRIATGGNRHFALAAPLSTPTVAPPGTGARHPRPSSGGSGSADLPLFAWGNDADQHVVVVWPVCPLARDVARVRLNFIYCGTSTAERKDRQ